MPARIAVVGLGTVGSWLMDALAEGAAGEVEVVLATSGRDGREAELEDAEPDVLAEAVNSPPSGEPGAAIIRRALERGIDVVTSDKWPVALHGVELAATAARTGAAFRAESTVMSGTPVLAPLIEKLGGERPLAARGVVNATVNQVLSEMGRGVTYDEALGRAQADGLAEPDPSADVDGRDECAKAMVLAALLFGIQLRPDDVEVRGVSSLNRAELDALAEGRAVRSVTTLDPESGGTLRARVEPVVLEDGDPLADVDGVENALAVRTRSGGELSVRGPGAGPEIAGAGILDDLRAVLGVAPPKGA
jgi:homoserine dehydrogenase